jgi:hypothetical protein
VDNQPHRTWCGYQFDGIISLDRAMMRHADPTYGNIYHFTNRLPKSGIIDVTHHVYIRRSQCPALSCCVNGHFVNRHSA